MIQFWSYLYLWRNRKSNKLFVTLSVCLTIRHFFEQPNYKFTRRYHKLWTMIRLMWKRLVSVYVIGLCVRPFYWCIVKNLELICSDIVGFNRFMLYWLREFYSFSFLFISAFSKDRKENWTKMEWIYPNQQSKWSSNTQERNTNSQSHIWTW